MSTISPPDTFLAELTRAIESQDHDAFAALLAEEVEAISYSVRTPPGAPARVVGRDALLALYREVPAELTHTISNGVVGPDRVAYTLTCTYPTGQLVVVNTIADVRDGLVTRQVSVEAWDE
jgi:SnoaL-like protein